MTATPEQKAILNAAGRVVRINARAGTGKTTTLAMLAQKYRDQRMLYLVFNRQAMEAAAKTFPANVQAFTVHAFAYRNEGYKWRDTLGHFSPADLLFAFRPEEQVLATISHDFLTFFLNSPFDKLEEALQPFRALLSEPLREVVQFEQQRIIQAARTLATAWNTGQKPCPHDFYLKLFHKSRQFHRQLARYDMILVDEGQDLSPIMLDALQACSKRIVLVGDSHQQIYSFRYAIDAMRKLASDEQFDLTLSFRFGKMIAELATVFIQEAKQERTFRIQGHDQKISQVSLYQQLPAAPQSGKTAILSRSNVALFENAMALKAQGTAFAFEKDIYPLLLKTLDVYWLAQKRPDKIRDPLLRTFHKLEELEAYAEDTDNFQLQGMIRIVEKYAADFPDVIFELGELTKKPSTPEPPPGIILSTIHSAKGQEYEQVYIDADLAETLSQAFRNGAEAPADEMNVAYVGFTRAIRHLYLPEEMQTALTPKWNAFLESCKKSLPRKIGRKRQAKLQPGDRVQTSHGAGVILEISEEYCLIDLAGQPAKLRERLANIRLAD